MGNCFGKQSSSFQGEGRALGASPANAPPASDNARAAAPPKIGARTGGQQVGRSPGAADQQSSESPGQAAARAAEERLKASQGKGKLGKQLDAQKAQTQTQTLAQTARDNLASRDADAATESRNWD